MRIGIESWFSGKRLFSIETDNIRLALEAGVRQGADLRGANLTPIRDDLWAILSASPAEVAGLRQALIHGHIDGSTYQGACACLVGTLAKVRGCNYDAIPCLKPSSTRPAERWFILIKPGDTPTTSESARLTLEWIDTWLANMHAAFGHPIAGEGDPLCSTTA